MSNQIWNDGCWLTGKVDLNVFHGEHCQANSLQSQNRLMTVTGGRGRLGENGEGTKQREKERLTHGLMNTENSTVIAREKGWKTDKGKEGDDDGRVINTQYNTQMICGRFLFLNLYNFINQFQLKKFNKKHREQNT